MNKKRILITGANGFIGKTLVNQLSISKKFTPIAAIRVVSPSTSLDPPYAAVGNINAETDWSHALENVHCLIHTAARVHVMNENGHNALAEYRKTNVCGTLNLAKQAAKAGVKRFIFISSIKVNGEKTQLNCPYTADDAPAPVEPYGISKMEAEKSLLSFGKETGMEIVIIRPVLVYGPGVKANFQNMMKWLSKGIILPLGRIVNKRSFIALENLVDLIITCIEHPAAANQIFLASDGHDLSTSELLKLLGIALGKPARLFPIPIIGLKILAQLIGKKTFIQRLESSLQVDIEKTQALLNWNPPIAVEVALQKTASHFNQDKI